MKVYQKITTEQIARQLNKFNSFAIFLHTRPDGDTVGAGIALHLAFLKQGKKSEIFCDSALGTNFNHFEECGLVHKTFFGNYDAFVAVDCANLSRLGLFSEVFSKHTNTFTVDHHKNQLFSHNNCIYPYSSTCQIVYEILDFLPIKIDKKIATYLFMGLATDTGNFSHSNADSSTFQLASKLLTFGVDNDKISQIFFKNISLKKVKLLQLTLSRTRTYFDEQLIIMYVLSEDLSKLGLEDDATEGLVQYAVNVDTSRVGVCICQHGENSYRVSMRSKTDGDDVSQICNVFGGGGHKQAAGCMLNGFLEDIIEKIVKAVGDYFHA